MSTVLQYINGLTAKEIIGDYANDEPMVVDIFGIAKSLGIKLAFVDFADIESCMEYPKDSVLGAIIDNDNNDSLTIMLKYDLASSSYFEGKSEQQKKDVVRRRQRFSVAHEIAHAAMHLSQTEKYRVEFRTDKIPMDARDKNIEYEANVFAGELLIPEDRLRMACENFLYPTLNGLCEIFDVSHSVMAARLNYLGISYIVND